VGELFRMARDRRRDRWLYRRHIRANRLSRKWSYPRSTAGLAPAIGNVAMLILATLNMFIHSRDAWTLVVPWGLTLSAVVALILMFTVWMGQGWSTAIG
jgi:uncharacterized membrane protein